MTGKHEILVGDCRKLLATLPERHYHCCVTSPPYFGLRDYKVDGQIGLESTPDEFVSTMVEVFRGVWRVLRDDGTVWLNLGDSYASNGKTGKQDSVTSTLDFGKGINPKHSRFDFGRAPTPPGLKTKDLMGMPWRVAFALQADGWYLRDAIVWHKPSPMPGSQRDRCTTAYELIFQLAKKPRYFFDMEAIREPHAEPWRGKGEHESDNPHSGRLDDQDKQQAAFTVGTRIYNPGGRIPRNVWKIASEGFSDAHFATFPRELPIRCIKAGTSEKGCCGKCGAPWARVVEHISHKGTDNTKRDRSLGNSNGLGASSLRGSNETHTLGWQPGCDCNADTVPCRVLDPFGGAGTTAIAACLLGRDCTLIELSPKYADMAERRIGRELRPNTYVDEGKAVDAPLFTQ